MPVRLRYTLLLPMAALLTLAAMPGSLQADNIDMLMSSLFPQQEMTYVGFDSVEREDIPVTSMVDRKFLIIDFRPRGPQDLAQRQADVHRICSTLLQNRALVRQLSQEGYDMISVAFDRHYQYDCL